MDTGTILMGTEPVRATTPLQRVAIYARVSSAEHKGNLASQAERLTTYCAARGYQVAKLVKEVGSGVNDARPELLALLDDQSIGLIVVEHKDRLTRFGVRSLQTLLTGQGRALEVVNQAENGTDDLLADLTAIVSSFCARLYGQRWAQRNTERMVAESAPGASYHETHPSQRVAETGICTRRHDASWTCWSPRASARCASARTRAGNKTPTWGGATTSTLWRSRMPASSRC
jgi:predicted site-specific integrase-resolvase